MLSQWMFELPSPYLLVGVLILTFITLARADKEVRDIRNAVILIFTYLGVWLLVGFFLGVLGL